MSIHDEHSGVPWYVKKRLFERALTVPRSSLPPTWRYEGTFYSAIPHSAYPVDDELVSAIRETDPGFTPLWVYYVFKPPPRDYGMATESVVFVRHAIARYIDTPATYKPRYVVTMPMNADFPVPNQIDRVLGGPKDKSIPEPYEPLTWDSYHRPWRQGTAREIEDSFIDQEIEARSRHARYLESELKYFKDDLGRYVTRKWDQVSDLEIRDAFRRQMVGLPLIEKERRIFLSMSSRKRR